MSREGKLALIIGMAPGRPTTLKWKAIHPRVSGQYTFDLLGEERKWGREGAGQSGWGSWGRMTMNKICCMKSSMD